MADTPVTGETVTPGDSQTTVQTPAAPVANASDPAEAERLRKESEQKDIRIRQLENEAAARKKAEDEAAAKQLEEQEEFKKLYETEREKREQLERSQEASTRQAELSTATEEVLKDYPEAVVNLAKTAGLGLSDTTDEAKASLKEKLDAFKATVSPGSQTATSTNPSTNDVPVTTAGEGLGRPRTVGFAEENSQLRDQPNPEKVGQYISGLNAVKRMKQDAGLSSS